MKIKDTLAKGLKREFEITVPAKDIELDLNKRLEAIGQRVKISGFRPGKVPLPLLKQRYKADALSEVIQAIVDSAVKKVVKENKLRPALKPNIKLKSYEEGKDLTFEVDFEILPTLGEIKLNNLSFEKYVVTIPAEQVSQTLETLAKPHQQSRPLQNSRKSKKGDIAIIDFKGVIENKPIQGGSGQDYPLELGSNSFIPGFEDQLIGHEKGAKIKVKVTFPKDYHEKSYANKEAQFEVTLKDIHEREPITIDKKLAETLGFKSLEDMKDRVEKSIASDYLAQSFLMIKRHVLDALAETFTFEVPQNMVDLEFENIWSQLLQELGIDQSEAANVNVKDKGRAKTFEEASGKTEEELKKNYKVIAERRVRLGILLAEIGNQQNISVSNQELMNVLTARAREFPGQEQQVFDFYRNNESALATLRAPLFENKVVDFILSQSKIKEISVTPDKFEKILIQEEEQAEKKISQESHTTKKGGKKKDG